MIGVAPSPFVAYSVTENSEPVVQLQWSDTAALGKSPWFDAATKKIEHIESLPAGWDGEGSPPISKDIANKARQIFSSVVEQRSLPDPHLVAVSGGLIGIEWQSHTRLLSITIEAATLTFIALDEATEEIYSEGSLRVARLEADMKTLVDWLIDRV